MDRLAGPAGSGCDAMRCDGQREKVVVVVEEEEKEEEVESSQTTS